MDERVTNGSGGTRSEVPARLVFRPKVRYVWFGGFGTFGMALIAMGIAFRGEPGQGPLPALIVGMGLAMFALAAVALRWAITADHEGVSITNYGRPHLIAWTDLEDIRLVPVESALDLGFHYMAFVTHEGQVTRPAAPTGSTKPGRTLPRLQQDLLAMQRRYTAAQV